MICFFFFKQKTAYEMRISDWSSDVCSSDLLAPDLNYRDGCLTARAFPVTVEAIEGAHFGFGEPVKIDLGSDVDVVLMRQDPPFDQIGRASCRERVCQYV